MSQLLKHLMDKYPTELFVYMDDIHIAMGNDIERHHQIVLEVLDLLEEESYFLHPAKCTFEQSSRTYLGIIVDSNQLKPDPKKTSALCNWPCHLSTVKEVWSILRSVRLSTPLHPQLCQHCMAIGRTNQKGKPIPLDTGVHYSTQTHSL
jgi:hypothetical protein